MAHVDNKLQGKQCCVSKGASGIFIDRPRTMGDSKRRRRKKKLNFSTSIMDE